jgi:lipopolysaccharide/colanic/teichoic acid biosynthesis glycosyltransferase
MLKELFYAKPALGKNYKQIKVIKIRTMYLDAEIQAPLLIKEKGLDGLGKIVNDPRIIPSRRWLRKKHIDELPNFLSLFNGDLSLVGVRPKTELFWSNFPKEHVDFVLQFKPGIFGIHYYHTNLRDIQDILEAEKEYVLKKIESPLKTDLEYFRGIICNKVFNKMDSC